MQLTFLLAVMLLMSKRARRARGRGVWARALVMSAGSAAGVGLGIAAHSVSAVELDAVFPGYRSAEAPPSAETLVQAAFANLFELDVAIFVDGETTGGGAPAVPVRFWSYRKRYADDTTKLFMATLEPDGREGIRLLQVDRDSPRTRAWIYSPEASKEPVRTAYRLTDPFLGTLSDRDPAEIRANLVALRRRFEILSAESMGESLRGGEVEAHRVTLRSLATRAYERVELVIASNGARILELRFFENGSVEPARTIVAPEDAWVAFGGRSLPGRLRYTDRIQGTKTELLLRYREIPEEVGEAPFLEVSFHEVPLPREVPR